MDVGAARGMLRRPVGLLPTVLERAGQRGASAQSGQCSGVQVTVRERGVQARLKGRHSTIATGYPAALTVPSHH